MNAQQEFWRRLEDEWLKPYCNERGYDIRGFKPDAKKISDVDARDFLRALDQKVVSVDSGGRFRMPQGKPEVIFWEHSTHFNGPTRWTQAGSPLARSHG